MPRLRAVRTDKEAAAVPEDQPLTVIIEEPGEVPEETKETKPDGVEKEKTAKDERKEPVQAAPEEDKEKVELKKRLQELERAEQAAQELAVQRQRELNDLKRQGQEREIKGRNEVLQAQLDMVTNALAAAQAESEASQQAWEAAAAEGDFKRQSEAISRNNRAQARMVQYEDAKAGLEAQIEEAKKAPVEQKTEPSDPIERAVANLPPRAADWLRKHTDYLTDQRKNAQIQHLHHESVAKGHTAFSQPYFDWIEEQLGMKEAPKADTEDEEVAEPPRRAVSAPVSREAPSLKDGRPVTTRITLSQEQREAARVAGISEIEYARQLVKLEQAKKEGRLQ